MHTREQLIEELLKAQQGDRNPRRPVPADASDPSAAHVAQAHAYLLELHDQVVPHAGSVPELWGERHIATIELAEKEDTGSMHRVRFGKSRGPRRSRSSNDVEISWRSVAVTGLSSLDTWRYRTEVREEEAPGRTSVTQVVESRVWMPPALMSGARKALDEALNELGWLPAESANDFDAGMGDGV
jgi:hypothetical protein